MRIRVIIPVVSDTFNVQAATEIERLKAPDTRIEVVNLASGPASIEGRYDEMLAAPAIVEAVRQAEPDGCDGVFVDCFGEPGVSASREVVSIPVVGGFAPAVLTASVICGRWSVVTMLRSVVPLIRDMARKLGVQENLASVRDIDTPVLELHDHEALRERLLAQIRLAVEQDKAEAIVLGCTGMTGLADWLSRRMAAEGAPVPVVDPTAAAIGLLESLIRSGITHSRLCYHMPADKLRIP